MNKLDEVAQVLGVTLHKKFKIKDEKNFFLLKEDGLYKYDDNKKLVPVSNDFLLDILMGRKEVVTPWKPKVNDDIYIPRIPARCRDNPEDLYEDGLACKTPKEANILYTKIIRYARHLKGFE